MGIVELFDQAMTLSARERKELAKLLIDSLNVQDESETAEHSKEHWGHSLVQLIQTLDLSEWETMGIDDPVEWVKAVRQEDEDHLKTYWNGEK